MKNKTVKSPSPFEKIADTLSKALGSTAAFVIVFFYTHPMVYQSAFNASNLWKIVSLMVFKIKDLSGLFQATFKDWYRKARFIIKKMWELYNLFKILCNAYDAESAHLCCVVILKR